MPEVATSTTLRLACPHHEEAVYALAQVATLGMRRSALCKTCEKRQVRTHDWKSLLRTMPEVATSTTLRLACAHHEEAVYALAQVATLGMRRSALCKTCEKRQVRTHDWKSLLRTMPEVATSTTLRLACAHHEEAVYALAQVATLGMRRSALCKTCEKRQVRTHDQKSLLRTMPEVATSTTLRLACAHHEEAVYALAQVATLGMRRSALCKTCEKRQVRTHDWKSLLRTVPEVATSTTLRLACAHHEEAVYALAQVATLGMRRSALCKTCEKRQVRTHDWKSLLRTMPEVATSTTLRLACAHHEEAVYALAQVATLGMRRSALCKTCEKRQVRTHDWKSLLRTMPEVATSTTLRLACAHHEEAVYALAQVATLGMRRSALCKTCEKRQVRTHDWKSLLRTMPEVATSTTLRLACAHHEEAVYALAQVATLGMRRSALCKTCEKRQVRTHDWKSLLRTMPEVATSTTLRLACAHHEEAVYALAQVATLGMRRSALCKTCEKRQVRTHDWKSLLRTMPEVATSTTLRLACAHHEEAVYALAQVATLGMRRSALCKTCEKRQVRTHDWKSLLRTMPEVATSTTLRLACAHHEEAVYALAQVATLGMRRSALCKTCEKRQVRTHDWKSLLRTMPEVATSTTLRLACAHHEEAVYALAQVATLGMRRSALCKTCEKRQVRTHDWKSLLRTMPEVATSTTLRLACAHHEEAVYALAQVATLGMRRSALCKTCEKRQVRTHDWKSLLRTVPEVATSTTLRLACAHHEEAVYTLAQVATLGMRRSALCKTCEKRQVRTHDWKSLLRTAGGGNFYNFALGLCSS